MRTIDVITKKRNGGELGADEIKFIVSGYTNGEIPDYQMSAFLMSVYFKGMSAKETAVLTKCMTESGEVYDLSEIHGYKIDKHSTGGVGDGISLVLAPVVASCGACVPMMSGRALGHTGGTLDKLESIPGFRTNLSLQEFRNNLEKIGMAMIGQSEKIAPADKKMYALRDATATVNSISLISASIMSKKIAEGTDGLLLDVKTGTGAFMETVDDARMLAKSMVEIGRHNGKNVQALITDMNQPLGNAVGNALEIKQAVEVLSGRGPADFVSLTIELAARMLVMAKVEKDISSAKNTAEKAIRSFRALEKFREMVKLQGGNPDVVENPDKVLPKAAKKIEICSADDGYINFVDAKKAGISAICLGAGRNKKEDSVSYGAGIVLRKKHGDKVLKNEPVAEFYFDNQSNVDEAKKFFSESYRLMQDKPVLYKLIREEVI